MEKTILQQPKTSTLLNQLVSLYSALKDKKGQQLEFDFSRLKWACPLLILPISVYINSTKSKSNFEKSAISSYLNIISFPKGVNNVSEVQKIIQSTKSYIPISFLRKDNKIERERLEASFAKLVYKNLNTTIEGTKNAIYYPISELVTNIFEHSNQNEGYIFGQFYPNKNYLDICIVDRGRGLRKTYKEDKDFNLSDSDAIIEVLKGNSTKPDKERGYGVWTSKKVICEGLGGSFVLISGSAALVSSNKEDKLFSLPNFNWEGVIVAYRIPKPDKPFDISPYVE